MYFITVVLWVKSLLEQRLIWIELALYCLYYFREIGPNLQVNFYDEVGLYIQSQIQQKK